MSSSSFSYLQNRIRHLDHLKEDLKENGNFVNIDDVWAYKDLSTEGKAIKEVIKQDFNLDHNMKKRIIDSFQ
ncbi:hypothetical protein FKG94_05220 [Exilibacterium tricleocarpae]|uniref:Uncharacterized protein n=1 Tax=Exilibacterium tricleocarpae TaxID=2591008 RepID=A0A545U3M2_9GAMM|nr:hypothetical protein [Exilibacterium tricleocarpae]TQV84068.1 hypothetical protein FKG94_05220 [Exilibacterium tricleocarpae]